MPEVSVSKKHSDGHTLQSRPEVLQPAFPVGRLFSLNPFAIIREFASEMDQVFHGGEPGAELQTWAPRVDMQQCGGNLVVSAELPGLKREDVKVEVAGDILTIQGERKQEHKEDHEGFHRWERSYGHFYRSIQLPEGARTDQVKAELKDGLLKVSIPVPDSVKKAKQIPVAG